MTKKKSVLRDLSKIDPLLLALGFILLYTLYDKIQFVYIHPPEWWNLMVVYLITLVILPITAILIYKDEDSIIFFSAGTLWYLFGLEDILFSILFGEALLPHMDWLDNHYFIGGFAKLIGSDMVTPLTITLSVWFATGLILIIRHLIKNRKK